MWLWLNITDTALGTGGRGGRGSGIGTIAAAGYHNATPTAELTVLTLTEELPADTDTSLPRRAAT